MQDIFREKLISEQSSGPSFDTRKERITADYRLPLLKGICKKPPNFKEKSGPNPGQRVKPGRN